MNTRRLLLTSLLTIASVTPAWATTEICGNDIDDDGNGLTDEGCYPTLTTGVCESPLSCGDTGMVSWSTGSLHYDLPPDINPRVPYGPGIGLRRFYTSQFTPGANPASVNKQPLGPGWQHTYLTYLDKYSSGGVNRVVLHTSQGRDVFYTYQNTSSGFDNYTPQAGEHVMSLKQSTSSPFNYQVQLLTGETLVYNNSGQIIEIWDTLPTPNKVLVTWTGTSNGNVSTVTDASGKRRLLFNYTNNLLTSVNFQINISSTWTTENTTSYDFGNGVSKDATSGWYVPANSTEWTNLLSGAGVSNPASLWKMQESSGNLADSLGSLTLTASGPNIYSAGVTGWSRLSVAPSYTLVHGILTQGSFSTNSAANPSTTSEMLLVVTSLPASSATSKSLYFLGGVGGMTIVNGKITIADNTNTATGTVDVSSSVRVLIYKVDRGVSQVVGYIDGSEVLKPTWSAPSSSTALGTAEGGPAVSPDVWAGRMLYGAYWTGTAAQVSDSQAADLIQRIKQGPRLLTSVTIGGQLAQKNVYSSGALTQITDASSNNIVSFAYDSPSSSTRRVNFVDTPRGDLAFDYSSSRTACSGKTVLYFNRASTGTCSSDAGCSSGYLCGGVGGGVAGHCFQAARCLTTSAVNGESVVTDVVPLGPSGGSCSGACTDVLQYSWASSPTGLLNVIGRKDPLSPSNFTSATYNSNGLPTQIGFGDTDTDPTTGANRTEWLFYDSTFPGRIQEIRRPSDLSPNASSCSASSTTGCTRTIFSYGTDNQPHTIEQDGFTLDSTGAVTTYANVITYTFDTKARITEIDGAVSGIKTTFFYNSSSDPLVDQFLSNYKIYTDATNYLNPQIVGYDFWGHPTGVKAPDGQVTCDTFDTARGFVASRRRAMNGQTDCSAPNSADLTTSWSRDSNLRLTQLQFPNGFCQEYTYDTSGRLYQAMRRDDCTTQSKGDIQTFIYSPDSLVTEIDTAADLGGAIVKKDIYSYFNSRRLQQITNPVDSSKFVGLLYDAAGKVTEVSSADAGAVTIGKTVYHFDGAPGRDNRVSSEERYVTSSTSDTWSLLYAWLGDQSQVTDGDSKATQSVRDDLGRLVKLVSPDMSYPTVRVYDAAGRVTTIVEALGGGTSQQTHTFSYDAMSRLLNSDYQGSCPTSGTAHAEIQRVYDTAPAGTCPIGAGCNHSGGHLAYVDTILMCSSTYNATDGALDQKTWFSYDQDGRKIDEYISDDSGRTAESLFEWTKNGALSKVTTPSGAVIIWGYNDTSGSNSDKDRVTDMYRTSTATPVIDSVKWNPFGPLQQYNWEANIGGTALMTEIGRNLAYRITSVKNGETTNKSSTLNTLTIAEDSKGRVTSRVYSPHDPTQAGLFDSYFLYDQQDRVICETTNSQTSCPTSGSNIKNNLAAGGFTHAGDWNSLLRPVPGSTGGLANVFDPSGYGTSHQVTLVRQNDGTPNMGDTAMAYDARGNRTYDDNTSTLTNDRRDYTYDARRNVVNVRGQYKTGGTWHYYDVASAFDAGNRRVFKSFYDETTTKTATWYFYYDALDRLTEVRFTPDTSASSTYSVFQMFWLGNRRVLDWQVDYPSVTTSKRYTSTDEQGRPYQLVTWPSSGNATVSWGINQSAWGFDNNIVGSILFQPLLFTGQYQDSETAAYENDGTTIHRPGLSLNGRRTYDAFVGEYCQIDPLAPETWSSYVYVNSNPVGIIDPSGRSSMDYDTRHIETAPDDMSDAIDDGDEDEEVPGILDNGGTSGPSSDETEDTLPDDFGGVSGGGGNDGLTGDRGNFGMSGTNMGNSTMPQPRPPRFSGCYLSRGSRSACRQGCTGTANEDRTTCRSQAEKRDHMCSSYLLIEFYLRSACGTTMGRIERDRCRQQALDQWRSCRSNLDDAIKAGGACDQLANKESNECMNNCDTSCWDP